MSVPYRTGQDLSKSSKSRSRLDSVSETHLLASRAASPLASSVFVPVVRKKALNTTFTRNICGDIFGSSMTGENSMLGMLYRSRIQEKLLKSTISASVEDDSDKTSLNEEMMNSVDNDIDGSSDSDNDVDDEMNPRQRLALTIRNWSAKAENDLYLLKEGAVHAIIALAGIEDHRIKLYCASTLYHLSSRAENREELLSLGAATGVITITMHVRHWKIAKLCAMTLCNLSIQEGGEPIMSKEGAVLALVILLGIRNQKLAPVCVQALYNMTSVDNHFKGMDRIIKAMLNLPPFPVFDAMPYIVKSLVNCSRFPGLRMRIVEDGALQSFTAFVNSLPHREQKPELVRHVAFCLKQLSDTPGCRVDMISKGCIEMLPQLLPYCNVDSRLLIMKTLHNLLKVVTTFPTIIFEIITNLVIDMILYDSHESLLQYGSSCCYIFTREKLRGIGRLVPRLLRALPKLLLVSDPLTQFFSITTSANMFFQDLCEDATQLEGLLRKFVEAGEDVVDTAAVQALVIALAQLSQHDKYMAIITQHDLLNQLLNLVLKHVIAEPENDIIREAGCVAVTRIALKIAAVTEGQRVQISLLLMSLIGKEDLAILENAISGIRGLSESNICHKELVSDELILRIAKIAIKHCNRASLCRMCCAVLAVMSHDETAHSGLSVDTVISILFKITKSDDIVTRELVAAVLCNISVNPEVSKRMISLNIVDVIDSLSGATSERIQELCARCICNLTCCTESHQMIIKAKVLETILMISLVRSMSDSTRRLCARSLLNMLTPENFQSMLAAGVIRAFSNLSMINCIHTQHICARSLLIFTSIEKGREEIASRRPVLHALFGLVKAESLKTKVLVGKAICNLLACEKTRKTVIIGGALSVVKIIATLSVEELRERCASVLAIMAKSPDLYDYLLREPVVPVLVLILQQSKAVAFQSALHALSNLSASERFRNTMIEKGCVSSIVNAILIGKVTSIYLAEEVCRAFCYLSFVEKQAEAMVHTGNMLIGLHALHRKNLDSKGIAEMMVIILRNLTNIGTVCHIVVAQDSVRLLRDLIVDYHRISSIVCKASVLVIQNLSRESKLHSTILKQGAMDLLGQIADVAQGAAGQAESAKGAETADDPLRRKTKATVSQGTIVTIVAAIDLLATPVECRLQTVTGGAIRIFTQLLPFLPEPAKHQMACSIGNMASSKECRDGLVQQGAPQLLVQLSKSPAVHTRSKCSLALGYLSENTAVARGTVASTLLLSLKAEEETAAHGTPNRRTATATHEFHQTNGSVMSNASSDMREVLNHNTKSLQGMIRDGLMRNKDHGIEIDEQREEEQVVEVEDDDDLGLELKGHSRRTSINSGISGAGSIGGTGTLPDMTAGALALEIVEDDGVSIAEDSVCSIETLEQANILTDASGQPVLSPYVTAAHAATQEYGGMAKKVKLELPYPELSADRFLEPPERSQELCEIPMDLSTLPKDANVTEYSKTAVGDNSVVTDYLDDITNFTGDLSAQGESNMKKGVVSGAGESGKVRFGKGKSTRTLADISPLKKKALSTKAAFRSAKDVRAGSPTPSPTVQAALTRKASTAMML